MQRLPGHRSAPEEWAGRALAHAVRWGTDCWGGHAAPTVSLGLQALRGPRTVTYVVPLGLELLLLKASVLPEVTQVGQGLPDDQQEDADQHHPCHSAPYDGSNVGTLHAL